MSLFDFVSSIDYLSKVLKYFWNQHGGVLYTIKYENQLL
jgi:hypothetical protein